MENQNSLESQQQVKNIKPINEDPLPHSKKNNEWLIIILSIVFVILASAAGFFGYKYFQMDEAKDFSESAFITLEVEEKVIKEEKDLMESVKNIFKDFGGLPVTQTDSGIVWWVSDDGFSILNEDSVFTVSTGVDCAGSNYEKEIEKLQQMKSEFSPRIDELMLKEGYKLNNNNSSSSYDDESFYDYIRGYENDASKCLLTINHDCEGFGDGNFSYDAIFSCTNNFVSNYLSQAPILNDLQLFDQVIRKNKETDEFLHLSVGGRMGGYYVVAKKIHGKWTELIGGQDTPPCDIVNEYKIPNEIISGCWDSELDEMIDNEIGL